MLHRPAKITPENGGILSSKTFITDFCEMLSRLSGKKTNQLETQQIVAFLNNVNPQQFINCTYSDVLGRLVQIYSGKVSRKKQEDYNPFNDYRDYQHNQVMQMSSNENQYKYTVNQSREIEVVEASELSDPIDLLGRFLDPSNIDDLFNKPRSYYINYNSISLPHTSVIFDSLYRDRTWPYNNEYHWLIRQSDSEGSVGAIRLRDSLVEIVSMKLNKFYIPRSLLNYNYYDRIFMGIKEFTTQSIHGAEFKGVDEKNIYIYDYNFELEIYDSDVSRLYVRPVNDLFIFRKPIASIESLTVEFRDSFDKFILDNDRGVFSVTTGNPTIFSGPEHHLNTGDLVYIFGFNSGTSTDIIINDIKGHFITKINETDFSINIDTTALISDDVIIVFGSKRIFFQLEFTSLEH